MRLFQFTPPMFRPDRGDLKGRSECVAGWALKVRVYTHTLFPVGKLRLGASVPSLLEGPPRVGGAEEEECDCVDPGAPARR
jgi:hypothetical protein